MPQTGADDGISRQGTKSTNTLVLSERVVMSLEQFDFIFVQWLDYMATLRTRCFPVKEFKRLVNDGDARFGISQGNLGTLQNDEITPVCDPVGQFYVAPDLSTLKPMYQGVLKERSATTIAGFQDISGSPLELCPRNNLVSTVATLYEDFGISSLIGFEIEIVFCRRNGDLTAGFEPLDHNHAWSTFTDEQYTTSYPIMLNIARELENIGISVQQVHSEAGPGQYEFVLPPLPPVQSVDTLIQAKQCIQQVSALHGLRATWHPVPFADAGSAAHANISLSARASSKELQELQICFMGAVLEHLPAICAFTMPQAISYGRVAEDHWTGGDWVAWGTQNREVPLRRIAALDGSTSRWELRCMDGTANMYLALGAVFKAGLSGIRGRAPMKLKDCLSNPSRLSNEGREHLGITQKLPTSIEESLAALEADEELRLAIGDKMVDQFVAMKKTEQTMLREMGNAKANVWLMERY